MALASAAANGIRQMLASVVTVQKVAFLSQAEQHLAPGPTNHSWQTIQYTVLPTPLLSNTWPSMEGICVVSGGFELEKHKLDASKVFRNAHS